MEEKLMYSKEIVNKYYEKLRQFTLEHPDLGRPGIVDISIGDDFGSLMYANMKKKKITKELHYNFSSLHLDSTTKEELIDTIERLNTSPAVSGIMIQLPLPDYLRPHEREILDSISPKKDVDGLSSYSMGKLFVGDQDLVPCTAKGILQLLKEYKVEISGKQVCIINRSNIVGKPLEQLLIQEDATVTMCHSKTPNLQEITSKADILIVAMNKKEFITKEYVKDGAVVIDVGVHKNEAGETVGDVNLPDCIDKVSLITPPTGSVGAMTIFMLAYNSAKAHYNDFLKPICKKK